MAKIKIMGSNFYVVSKYPKADLEKISKYRPRALNLYDKDDNKTFCVGLGTDSVNKFGVGFGSTTNDEHKYALCAQTIPEGVEDVKKYVQETVGVAIINLNKVEENLDAALAEISTEIQTVSENIEVVL